MTKKARLQKKYRAHEIFLIACFSILSSVATGIIVYLIVMHSPITTVIHKSNAAEMQEKDEYTEKSTDSMNKHVLNDTSGLASQIILHGSRDKKQIALTFDAEMTDSMRASYLSGQVKSSYNKNIIDTLMHTNTKATLFLTGMWITLYPEVTKDLGKNPLFELASHSYADTSYDGACFGLKQIKDSQDLEDIETTQKLLRDVAGVEAKYFRFPGGCYSETDLDIVMHKAGLQVVHWDVVGEDGFNENTQSIVQNVVQHTQNGSIIVLHMNGAPTAPKTADALPGIISALKAKGFTFVKVSELLGQ